MKAIVELNVVSYTKCNCSVYSLNIHLVLVTKSRRQLITTEVLQRLREIFDATGTLLAMHSFRNSRVNLTLFHKVISFPPDVQVSTLEHNLIR